MDIVSLNNWLNSYTYIWMGIIALVLIWIVLRISRKK